MSEQEPIHRTIIHVEVLSRGPLIFPEYPEGGELYDNLQRTIQDCIDGDKIGDWSIASDEVIETDERLQEALINIGNDGSFFDADW